MFLISRKKVIDRCVFLYDQSKNNTLYCDNFRTVDNEAKVFCLTHFSFIDVPHHINTANPVQFYLHA